MKVIAPLAGLILAVSGFAALAQAPAPAPSAPAASAPAAPAAPAPLAGDKGPGTTTAGTPRRPEVQISRPIEMMLTQQAVSMSYDGKSLVLTGVAPLTTFAVDRPERIGGTMTTEQFAKLWNVTADIFKNDPPNAALTILGDTPTQVVVELSHVTQSGSTLTFEVGLLDGDLPAKGGPVTLVMAPTVYRPLNHAGPFLRCWWSPYWVQRVCRAAW
ncbi:hypothetical protein [Roseixanthobacter glucoisosaccharinicivorans]|uniref:hypothetical protein n=1 Tax=Roseixanthobacter glucoisosaccharinicivorans TaxID=3119923 RepID=UPI00372A5661